MSGAEMVDPSNVCAREREKDERKKGRESKNKDNGSFLKRVGSLR